MNVSLTPAWHNWQNESPKHHTREFAMEDYCGFWIDTPDGSVWAVGDRISVYSIGSKAALSICFVSPATACPFSFL